VNYHNDSNDEALQDKIMTCAPRNLRPVCRILSCDFFPQPSPHAPEYRQRVCQYRSTIFIIYKTSHFFK
jgi:hypothetical protein